MKDINIIIDQFFIGRNITIRTILGSCVSICLFDEVTGLIGMNHSLNKKSNEILSLKMLKEMRKLTSNKLKAKLFDGIISNMNLTTKIANDNIKFSEEFLKKENIKIVEKDISGYFGRFLTFNSLDFSVKVRKIKKQITK